MKTLDSCSVMQPSFHTTASKVSRRRAGSPHVIGQYKMQTADCRLQTGYKMQTRYKMQTADCRLGTKCRLAFETVFFVFFFFYIISFYNLPVATQSLFRRNIPRKLALPGNDLAPLLEIYFLNEVSKINSFLNMILISLLSLLTSSARSHNIK